MSHKDIGALVRQARMDAGLSQTDLGHKIGASRYWVAEFEQGKPRVEFGLVLKTFRALGLSLTIDVIRWSSAHVSRGSEMTRATTATWPQPLSASAHRFSRM
ncbi:MAG: putative DNA-binding protein [Gemmatimonadetes bacterium]|nr:putative DNA-binding protein [Gemmatimonadota bacterium]